MFKYHLKGLLWKNFLLWKRNWIGSLLEIVIPIIFVLLLFAIRNSSQKLEVPQASYVDQIRPTTPIPSPDISYLFRNCQGDQGRLIGLSPPNSPIMRKLGLYLTISMPPTLQIFWFDNNTVIDDYITTDNYSMYPSAARICFGVVLTNNNEGKYEYLIRFNHTSEANSLPNYLQTKPVEELKVEDLEQSIKYATSGFMQLQIWLDNFILQEQTGQYDATIFSAVTPMTIPEHYQDSLLINLRGTLIFFIAYPFLYPYLRMTHSLISEKEKRIREGMKMMGLSNSALYSSWIITYAIIYIIISIIYTLLLKFLIFSYSNFGYLFIWVLMFCFSLIALSFFMSVFFSKAKTGIIGALLIFLAFHFILFAIRDQNHVYSKSLKLGVSLAPVAAMGLGSDILLAYESIGWGITNTTISKAIDNYSFAWSIGMLAIDTVYILLIALYLDQIFPTQYGIRKHPLFFLNFKSYKKKTHKNVKVMEESKNSRIIIEDVDDIFKNQDSKNESIGIYNLTKIYPKKEVALDNFSLNIYKNQVLALIGHNGAGKTTLISILNGLISATSGNIIIFGNEINKDISKIRKSMGVCPQNDVLFDDLTVREHLELYSLFKGMKRSLIKTEINKAINDLDLKEKINEKIKNLSGGQKRRLSVAIAFIADSKLILLDEPSSGMDIVARHKLWTVIKNNKHDRAIILTTHYMDEAEYLGDRIAIINEGKLVCCGSSLFLKKEFDIGYHLTILKKNKYVNSQNIINLIKSNIPDMTVTSNFASDLSISLPINQVSKFKDLFDDLDKNINDLDIESYGVSITTLEEVFLKTSKLKTYEKKSNSNLIIKEIDESNNNEDKNDNYDKSCLGNEIENETKKPGLHSFSLFRTQFLALIVKRLNYIKRDKQSLFFEILIPIISILIGLALLSGSSNLQNPYLYINDNVFQSKPINYMINQNDFFNFRVPEFFTESDNDHHVDSINAVNLQAFDQEVFNTRNTVDPPRYFSIYYASLAKATNLYAYITFFNSTARESIPYAINYINNKILKYATNNPNASINAVIAPLKLSQSYLALGKTIDSILVSFAFALGISFIPANIIAYVVKERESNVKHQQLVSGVSIKAYWFSNYLVDFIKFILVTVVSCLLVLAFNVEDWLEDDTYAVLWLLFILYGSCIIPFSYLLSFLFKDPGKAQLINLFLNFVGGFILALAIWILRLISQTKNVAKTLHYIFRIMPTFSFCYGLLNISSRKFYQVIDQYLEPKSSWDLEIAGFDLLYLGIMSIIYLFLIFLIELCISKIKTDFFFKRDGFPINLEYTDDDVKAEFEYIKTQPDKHFAIKADRLTKFFTKGLKVNKVAVNQVSFGVKKGECFALLGANGAGKSTAFRMLTGEIHPSSGRAVINGHDLAINIKLARRYMGYCPQNNALLDNLTGKEHLYLYAALKGIPKSKKKAVVDDLINQLGLKKIENVRTDAYSGGNKRKLSVGIALIGNPPIIFLDEPSTGMDPEARRLMWNMISNISMKKRSCVLLTTHSMEEAEALANRLAIMVDGTLRCVGSPQHIKSKFGGSYEIEIKFETISHEKISHLIQYVGYKSQELLNIQEIQSVLKKLDADHFIKEIKIDGTGSEIYRTLDKSKSVSIEMIIDFYWIFKLINNLEKLLTASLGKLMLIEQFHTYCKFRVMMSNLSIGKMFEVLEANKESYKIVSYSIQQTTLENIFNMFANNRINSNSANLYRILPTTNPTVGSKERLDTKEIVLEISKVDKENDKLSLSQIEGDNQENHHKNEQNYKSVMSLVL